MRPLVLFVFIVDWWELFIDLGRLPSNSDMIWEHYHPGSLGYIHFLFDRVSLGYLPNACVSLGDRSIEIVKTKAMMAPPLFSSTCFTVRVLMFKSFIRFVLVSVLLSDKGPVFDVTINRLNSIFVTIHLKYARFSQNSSFWKKCFRRFVSVYCDFPEK